MYMIFEGEEIATCDKGTTRIKEEETKPSSQLLRQAMHVRNELGSCTPPDSDCIPRANAFSAANQKLCYHWCICACIIFDRLVVRWHGQLKHCYLQVRQVIDTNLPNECTHHKHTHTEARLYCIMCMYFVCSIAYLISSMHLFILHTKRTTIDHSLW